MIGSISNMSNAAIGAGVLSFPFAINRCGLIVGPLLLASLACLLGIALMMIGESAVATKSGSYQELVTKTLGERAGKGTMLCMPVSLCVSLLCRSATGSLAPDASCPTRLLRAELACLLWLKCHHHHHHRACRCVSDDRLAL